MDIYKLREESPIGTDYICAVWGCDIEYFKNGDDLNELFEWNGCDWVSSRVTKQYLDVEFYDVIICR